MKINDFMQSRLMDKTSKVLSRALDFRSAKQQVISGNLANVDTPGYKPKELRFEQELQRATEKNSHDLTTTDPAHLSNSSDLMDKDFSIGTLVSEGETAQLNLDTEMAKMAQNNLLYEASVRLLSKKLQLLKTAIEGSRR